MPPHTEETKRKISETRKQRFKEGIIVCPHKGLKGYRAGVLKSEEHKLKIRLSNQAHFVDTKGYCRQCKLKLTPEQAVPHLLKINQWLCKLCRNKNSFEYKKKLRLQVIEAYGGKCACCGEPHEEFLSVDHINGRGKKDTPDLKHTGHQMYGWLIKNGFPKDGFLLLCYNCNCSLGFRGYCPHGNIKRTYHRKGPPPTAT